MSPQPPAVLTATRRDAKRPRHREMLARDVRQTAIMPTRLRDTIAALDHWQTLIGCRALVLMLDRRMARDPRSNRPQELAVTDFRQWVRLGGPPVAGLNNALCDGDATVTAAVGRRLMQTCLHWGFTNEVRAACRLAYAPVHHLGTLPSATIVAALAGVMLWHPSRPTLKSLFDLPRRPQKPAVPQRRYPWFQTPEPASEKPASIKADAAQTLHGAHET